MKKIILIVSIILLLIVECSYAAVPQAKYKYGLGIIIGEPTGISGKFWLNKKEAYDGGISWRFGDYFNIHADYLYHNYNVFDEAVIKGLLPLYYGFGGRVIFDNEHRYRKHYEDKDYDIIFGARAIAGLEYLVPEAPLDIFLELAPVINLIPEIDLDITGGLGIRFLF